MNNTFVREEFDTYTLISVNNHFNVQQILEFILEYYGSRTHLKSIWDFSGSKVDHIEISSHFDIAKVVKQGSMPIEGNLKAALVFGTEHEEMLGNIFEAFAASEDVNVEYSSFTDLASAINWIS